jgi:hypothetical protein
MSWAIAVNDISGNPGDFRQYERIARSTMVAMSLEELLGAVIGQPPNNNV